MKTPPLYIPLGEAPTLKLQGASVDFVPLDSLAPEHVAGGRRLVLVTTSTGTAEEQGWQLVGRGVSPTQIEFVTLDQAGIAGEPKHLFWRDAQPFRLAPKADTVQTYPSGIGFLDKNLKWRWRLRELMVVAGPYSSGKSTVLQQLAFNFVRTNIEALNGAGALICAWEDEASQMRRNLDRFIETCEREHGECHEYLLDKIHYVCRGPHEDRLIPWYMDLVSFYHNKMGVKFFTLDPWNEMDHKKDSRQIETEYVRDAMREFRKLVDSLGIILPIATHVPAKMIRGDGTIEPFKIAHSFGSGNFGNKADRGLCIVRTKKFEPVHGHTIFRLDKSKVEEVMGTKGTVAASLNIRNFMFEYDGYATEGVKDVWKD